jgi:hypothetical protein
MGAKRLLRGSQSCRPLISFALPHKLIYKTRAICCFPVPVLPVLSFVAAYCVITWNNQTRHDLSFCLTAHSFIHYDLCLLAPNTPRTCFKNSLCPIEPLRSTETLVWRHASAKADPTQPDLSPSLQAQPLAHSPPTRSPVLGCVQYVSCPCRLRPPPLPPAISHRHLRHRHRHHTPNSTSQPPSFVTCPHGSPCYQYLHRLLPHRLPHNTQYRRNITARPLTPTVSPDRTPEHPHARRIGHAQQPLVRPAATPVAVFSFDNTIITSTLADCRPPHSPCASPSQL